MVVTAVALHAGPRAPRLVVTLCLPTGGIGERDLLCAGVSRWGLWSAEGKGLSLPQSCLLPELVREAPALWLPGGAGPGPWGPLGCLTRGEEQNLHTLVLLPQRRCVSNTELGSLASGSTEHGREQEPAGPPDPPRPLVGGEVPRSCSHQAGVPAEVWDPQPLFLWTGPRRRGHRQPPLVSWPPLHPGGSCGWRARHGTAGPPPLPPCSSLSVGRALQHVAWPPRATPARGAGPAVPLCPLLLPASHPHFSQADLSFAASPHRPQPPLSHTPRTPADLGLSRQLKFLPHRPSPAPSPPATRLGARGRAALPMRCPA